MENKGQLIKYTTQVYLSVPLVKSQSILSLFIHTPSVSFIHSPSSPFAHYILIHPSILPFFTYGQMHWTEYIQYSIYSTSIEVRMGYQCQVVKVHNNSTVPYLPIHLCPFILHLFHLSTHPPVHLVTNPILFFFHLQNFKSIDQKKM